MPRLWSHIAGALGLLTLAVLVLNAGVFWIVVEQNAVKRQSDLAWSIGGAMEAQLGAALRSGAEEADLIESLKSLGNTDLGFETLVMVGPDLVPLATVHGRSPSKMDAGLRTAFFAKSRHMNVEGSAFEERRVVVTAPVVGAGKPIAALRIALPLDGPSVPGGPLGFAVLYVVACGAIIALFGWIRLHRSLVIPIQRLQQGTETIASGDFGHQLPKEGTAELQQLVESLNEMSAALASFRSQSTEQVLSLEAANASLREAQDALIRSERLAGVGRMAAGLAHEVGNPLAAVMATVDLMQDGLVEAKKQPEMLERARSELDRIHVIIQALLGYAHVGSGEPAKVDVRALVHEAVATVHHQPLFQGKAVSIVGNSSAAHVWMDGRKLHQVVVNLLHNAADAPQCDRIEIVIDANASGEIEVRCEDNGSGFEPPALEHAFEPFFTTKDVGAGTGLGLTTCLSMIEQAKGTIEVFNLPESGACVRIRLPSC